MAYILGKMLVHGFFLFACLAKLAVSSEMIITYVNDTTITLTRRVRNETREIIFHITNYDLITGGESDEVYTFLREIADQVVNILFATLEPSSASIEETLNTTIAKSTRLASTEHIATSTTLQTTQPITTLPTLTTATPTTLVTEQVTSTSATTVTSNVTSTSATTVTSDITSTSDSTVTSDITSTSDSTVTSDITSASATTVSPNVTSTSDSTVTSDITSTSATTVSPDATTETATWITTKLTSADTPPTTTQTTAYNSTSATSQATASITEQNTADYVTNHVTDPSTKTGETSATTFTTSSASTLSPTQFPVTTSYPPATTSYPPVMTSYPPATTSYPPATTSYPPVMTSYPPATTSYPPATTVSETPITTFTQPPTTNSSQPPATTITQISVTTPSQHSTTGSPRSPTFVPHSSSQATTTSPRTPHPTTPVPDLLLESLLGEVKDPARLNVEQVKNYTNQVIGFNECMLKDIKVAEMVVQVVGYLSWVNVSVSFQAEIESRTNTRLRQLLDNYTSEVDLNSTGGYLNITENGNIEIIVVSTLYLNRTLQNGTITFPISREHRNEINVTLILPSNIFTEDDNETRIQYVAYRRSQLFVSQKGFSGSPYLGHQRVVSVSVKDKTISNLTTPVEIRLPKIQPGQKHSCMFWDIKRSDWSTEGVTLFSEDVYSQTCHSSHLTSFSLLMNVGNIEEDEALTYLTYIGCGISIICLLMTIVTYSIFRCLNKEKSGKLLLNLCVALMLLNVTFLAATVDVSGYSEISCVAAGMLLHYFLLAALAWMLVEAIELYQALVTVFRKYERRYMIKRCLLAWGAPAIIMAVTAALSRESYSMNQHDKKFCFLTNSNLAVFIGSVIGPSSLIILANIFVFIMVTRVIFRENFKQTIKRKPSSVTPTQIRGMFSVMFLLGVTWVFGPLAYGDAQIIFNYLFCISNSLQGFLIFVFRCLFNSEAKQSWLQLLQTGTLKRRRGPVTLPATDTTSKSGDRRHSNNTTNTTISTSDGFHSEPQETTNNHDSDLKSNSQEQKKCKAYGYRLFSSMSDTLSKDFLANTLMANSDTNYENTWTHL